VSADPVWHYDAFGSASPDWTAHMRRLASEEHLYHRELDEERADHREWLRVQREQRL
jgi:hypothetical protein